MAFIRLARWAKFVTLLRALGEGEGFLVPIIECAVVADGITANAILHAKHRLQAIRISDLAGPTSGHRLLAMVCDPWRPRARELIAAAGIGNKTTVHSLERWKRGK
jgi:hypothetical protein